MEVENLKDPVFCDAIQNNSVLTVQTVEKIYQLWNQFEEKGGKYSGEGKISADGSAEGTRAGQQRHYI